MRKRGKRREKREQSIHKRDVRERQDWIDKRQGQLYVRWNGAGREEREAKQERSEQDERRERREKRQDMREKKEERRYGRRRRRERRERGE